MDEIIKLISCDVCPFSRGTEVRVVDTDEAQDEKYENITSKTQYRAIKKNRNLTLSREE